MRLLLNENMPKSVLQELRVRGHDVLSVKESMRGDNDVVILARAQGKSRLVVTQDRTLASWPFVMGNRPLAA